MVQRNLAAAEARLCGIFSNRRICRNGGMVMSLQEEIIAALGVKPAIDVEAEVQKRVDF